MVAEAPVAAIPSAVFSPELLFVVFVFLFQRGRGGGRERSGLLVYLVSIGGKVLEDGGGRIFPFLSLLLLPFSSGPLSQ